MNDHIIKAEKITKTYIRGSEKINAVDGIDFAACPGDFTAIMGPSGSGKTTLLDVLGCLDTITSGTLTVRNTDVSAMRESELVKIRSANFGFVFQEFLLLPELTAFENVTLPLYFAGLANDEDRAGKLLQKMGLGARLRHLPKELSGGECQRVAIARAIMTEPKVLFADEPTGNLDTQNSQQIFSLFRQLNEQDNLTIIVATHDEALGGRAKNVVRLQDGRIVR